MRVKCLAQEHNTMSPARARTRTARSGDERTNHEAITIHIFPYFSLSVSLTLLIYSTVISTHFALIAMNELEELEQEPRNKTENKIGDNKPGHVKQPMSKMSIIQSLNAILTTLGNRNQLETT